MQVTKFQGTFKFKPVFLPNGYFQWPIQWLHFTFVIESKISLPITNITNSATQTIGLYRLLYAALSKIKQNLSQYWESLISTIVEFRNSLSCDVSEQKYNEKTKYQFYLGAGI